MIIEKIHIKHFRGFEDVGFNLGSQITIISGQNGTQKTTLLGLLSQPFSLVKHPLMADESPLCGGNYKSSFSEKFKLSPVYDKVGSHEWTIFTKYDDPYTVVSINRDKRKGTARFWQKGTHEADSGYLRYPVIYLSLKRLLPIGEDNKIHTKATAVFSDEEKQLFKELHNEILISRDNINAAEVLESSSKTTLGVNTDRYDWMLNSAGQDNVGKIILALLSFKRLKEKYQKDYKGGLLFIDELDATMYPGSQEKLLKILRKYSSKFGIQIVFTTHSLRLLQLASNLYKEAQENLHTANQIQLVYLEKEDDHISILQDVSYATIDNRLKVSISTTKTTRIPVYTEDEEAVKMAKCLLKGFVNRLNFIKSPISCNLIVDLIQRHIPTFTFPDSIVILDGDVKEDHALWVKLQKLKSHNWLVLPSVTSPERLIASFLEALPEADSYWSSIHPDYRKQVCFRDYNLEDILADRVKAKEWFRQQEAISSSWCNKSIRRWIKESNQNKTAAQGFVNSFVELFNKIAKELSIPQIVKR